MRPTLSQVIRKIVDEEFSRAMHPGFPTTAVIRIPKEVWDLAWNGTRKSGEYVQQVVLSDHATCLVTIIPGVDDELSRKE